MSDTGKGAPGRGTGTGSTGTSVDLRRRAFPVVLAGPSGSGKTTVGRALERRGRVLFSVSATTRPRRTEEEDGVDYRFLPRDEFEARIEAGELLEWAEVHGHLYGTPRDNLRRAREAGRHLLLDIDVQGARSLREKVPEAVTIFLVPPDGARILRRLDDRGSEDEEELRRRLRAAEEELRRVEEFDYVVVNDDLAETVAAVEAVIRAEESRTSRLGERVQEMMSALDQEIRTAVETGRGSGTGSRSG